MRLYIFGTRYCNFCGKITMWLENPRFEQKLVLKELIETTSNRWLIFIQEYELVLKFLRLWHIIVLCESLWCICLLSFTIVSYIQCLLSARNNSFVLNKKKLGHRRTIVKQHMSLGKCEYHATLLSGNNSKLLSLVVTQGVSELPAERNVDPTLNLLGGARNSLLCFAMKWLC